MDTTPKKPLVISFEEAFPQEYGGFRENFTANDFQERLCLIEACLRTGQIPRAQLLLRTLASSYPMLYHKMVDVHVHNSFLEAFLHSSPTDGMGGGMGDGMGMGMQGARSTSFRDALKWFNQNLKRKMSSSNDSTDPLHQANLTSYAILIRGALAADRSDVVKLLAEDMKRSLRTHQCTHHELLRHPRFTEPETDALARILGLHKPGCTAPSQQAARLLSAGAAAPNAAAAAVNLPLIKDSSGPLLPYIKQNLKLLSQPAEQHATTMFDLQMRLEEESCRIGLERIVQSRETVLEKTGMSVIAADMQRLMNMWHTELTPLIEQEIQKHSASPLVESVGRSLDGDSVLDSCPFV